MPFQTAFRFWSYNDSQGKLKPPPPAQRVYGPISHIGPLTVCAYIVETKAGLVAIDAGYDSDGDLLPNNIRTLGLDPRELKLILLTHWHWDHASGTSRLAKLSGAKVMIHEKDAEIVESGKYRGETLMPPARIDKRLQDGDVVEMGGVTFKTAFCPGQSAGEVVFETRVEGSDGPCRVIFPGDAFGFKHDVKELDYLGYPGVVADYRRTVEVLRKMEFDLCLPGHPHQILGETNVDGNPFITHAEWLKLVNGRSQQAEDFLKKYPQYLAL